MKIDASKFLTLTAMLAAPLIAAPLTGCVLNDTDDDGNANTTNNNTTDPTESTTTMGSASDTTQSTGDETAATEAATESLDGSTGTAGGTTTGTLSACCEPTLELGCSADAEIEACVCEGDPLCCDEGWDEICVEEVGTFGCAEACPGTGEGGTTTSGGSTGE